jgi:RHS repeat-associated protein
MYQAKLPNGDTPLYDREPGGRLDGRRTQAGGHDYYIDDGNGSPVALIGGSGNLEITNTYDPYGNRTACLVSQQGCASSGLTDAVGFNSSFLDCFNTQNSSGDCTGTGLYKMGQRYYNAKLGNWTQPDPIGGSYSFAGDDPVNRADPTGLLGVAPIQPESYDCPATGCPANVAPTPASCSSCDEVLTGSSAIQSSCTVGCNLLANAPHAQAPGFLGNCGAAIFSLIGGSIGVVAGVVTLPGDVTGVGAVATLAVWYISWGGIVYGVNGLATGAC